METLTALLIPALMTVILIRLLLLPVKTAMKVGIHSICGFICLWILNTAAPFTGIYFPVNAITVLAAGALGIPGIGLMAILTAL